MNNATAPVTAERAAGVLIAGAVGDALGWPQENRSRIRGGAAARSVDPAPEFRTWVRQGGTRYTGYDDLVKAGEYSDDTQLTLAVCRARAHGGDWYDWLTRVELPLFPTVQRGAGGAVLRAARSWVKGTPPWSVRSAASSHLDAADRYFRAGGNGAAMRVAGHVLDAGSGLLTDDLDTAVIRDATATHGHPAAVLGAVIYARALRHVVTKQDTLEYGEVIDLLLDDSGWADPALLLNVVDDEWQYGSRATGMSSAGEHPAIAWETTANEVHEGLRVARDSLARGSMANDTETLAALGCFDSHRSGAGTVAALASVYVLSRTANRPLSGLLRMAFLPNADTDTLASMTGALLGALHGTSWLNGLETQVQDHRYLRDVASSLAFASPFEASGPPRNVSDSLIRRWTGQLATYNEPDVLLDGRPWTIEERVELPVRGSGYIVRILGRSASGQSVIIDRQTKQPPERIDRYVGDESGLFTLESSPSRPKASALLVSTEIKAADLEASYTFYTSMLDLTVEREGGGFRLAPGVLLSQSRASDTRAGTTRGLILQFTHQAPELIADRAARAKVEYRWADGREVLWLQDPDGNRVRIARP